MKTFKTLKAAAKHAQEGVLLRVNVGAQELYIAGPIVSINEVVLLKQSRPEGGSWSQIGHVTMRHLNRLGNANYAERTAQCGCITEQIYEAPKVAFAEVVSFKQDVYEVAVVAPDGSHQMCTPTWNSRGAAQAYADAVMKGERKPEIREVSKQGAAK